MRSFLQMLSGLILAVGLLTVGWALAGRPTVDAARIGNGFQVVGTTVVLYALLRIVWEPWVRPSLANVRAAIKHEVRGYRRRLHMWLPSLFPPIPTYVHLGTAEAKATGEMRLSGELKRGGTLEERVSRLEQDVAKTVNDLAQRLKEQDDRIKEGDNAVVGQLAETQATVARVRVDDALRLLLGIALTLIGAALGSIG
jgi:hypothetical protein